MRAGNCYWAGLVGRDYRDGEVSSFGAPPPSLPLSGPPLQPLPTYPATLAPLIPPSLHPSSPNP